MELVPIIWQTLLYGTILLTFVLVVSFVLSKIKKKEIAQPEFQLVPDRPLNPAGRFQAQNIQITSSRMEREQIMERQPKIYDINQFKHTANPAGSKRRTNVELADEFNSQQRYSSHNNSGGTRRPRYTIINDKMNQEQFPLRKNHSGDLYRFSNTVFYT